MTVLRASELTVGQTFETVVVEDLNRTQIVQYAGASGDYNPLHTDELFARGSLATPVLAHGMLTMGLTGRMSPTGRRRNLLASASGSPLRCGRATR